MWQEARNNYYGYYISEFIYNATAKSRRGYSKDNMKCVSKNIHKFILLPSFLLSFIHIYVLAPLFKLDVADAE